MRSLVLHPAARTAVIGAKVFAVSQAEAKMIMFLAAIPPIGGNHVMAREKLAEACGVVPKAAHANIVRLRSRALRQHFDLGLRAEWENYLLEVPVEISRRVVPASTLDPDSLHLIGQLINETLDRGLAARAKRHFFGL